MRDTYKVSLRFCQSFLFDSLKCELVFGFEVGSLVYFSEIPFAEKIPDFVITLQVEKGAKFFEKVEPVLNVFPFWSDVTFKCTQKVEAPIQAPDLYGLIPIPKNGETSKTMLQIAWYGICYCLIWPLVGYQVQCAISYIEVLTRLVHAFILYKAVKN